jgi:hypothetical protein
MFLKMVPVQKSIESRQVRILAPSRLSHDRGFGKSIMSTRLSGYGLRDDIVISDWYIVFPGVQSVSTPFGHNVRRFDPLPFSD